MKSKDKLNIKVDKSLDQYDNKVLFPKKIEAAKEMLKHLSLSTICKSQHAM